MITNIKYIKIYIKYYKYNVLHTLQVYKYININILQI